MAGIGYTSKHCNRYDSIHGQKMLTNKLDCQQKKRIIKNTVWNVAETWTLTFLYDIIKREMMGKPTRRRTSKELLHDIMEGRDYSQFSAQMEQDGYRITCEKACQNPAGDSRRLKKKKNSKKDNE